MALNTVSYSCSTGHSEAGSAQSIPAQGRAGLRQSSGAGRPWATSSLRSSSSLGGCTAGLLSSSKAAEGCGSNLQAGSGQQELAPISNCLEPRESWSSWLAAKSIGRSKRAQDRCGKARRWQQRRARSIFGWQPRSRAGLGSLGCLGPMQGKPGCAGRHERAHLDQGCAIGVGGRCLTGCWTRRPPTLETGNRMSSRRARVPGLKRQELQSGMLCFGLHGGTPGGSAAADCLAGIYKLLDLSPSPFLIASSWFHAIQSFLATELTSCRLLATAAFLCLQSNACACLFTC